VQREPVDQRVKVLAIDFLISFSYTLWPRQPKET
jgi:hypothetical protein